MRRTFRSSRGPLSLIAQEGNSIEYNRDKVDDYTLALLYLVTHEVQEGIGARAWKGFDWGTMNRLHEKGYISNPIGKAKSVFMEKF
jgi:hypothetical protein